MGFTELQTKFGSRWQIIIDADELGRSRLPCSHLANRSALIPHNVASAASIEMYNMLPSFMT